MADDAPKKRGRPKKSEAPKEIDWAEELGQQMDALAAQRREASKFAADFLKKQQRIREANEKARQKAELAALKAEEALAKAQIEEEEARKKAAEQRSQEIAKFLARQKEQQKNREKELKAERDATLDAEAKLAEEQLKQEEELQKQLNQTQKKLEKLEKKRSKVVDDLTKKFGSSNVAKVFAGKYVDKDGKISKEGEKTAQRMQRQRTFIKSLVSELARLPIFQKAGRAFQQFGLMNVFAGISKIRKGGFGNIVAGSGQTLFGLGIMLVPALATAFGTVMSTIVANKIAEAVALGTMKGNAGSGGGGFWFGGKGKRTGLRGAPKTALGRAAIKMMGSPAGRLMRKAGPLGLLTAGLTLWDMFDIAGQSRTKADRGDRRGAVKSGLAAVGVGGFGLLGTAIGSLGGPVGAMIGGTLGIMLGEKFRELSDATNEPAWYRKIINFFMRFPWFKKKNGDKDSNVVINKGKITAPTSNLGIKGGAVDPNKPTSVWKDPQSGAIGYVYGSSKGQGSKLATVYGRNYTKPQLERMAANGLGGLEVLRGSEFSNISYGDFQNDALAARQGTSQILGIIGRKMFQQGFGKLRVTSAMGSATSPHSMSQGPNKVDHYAGQKVDLALSQYYQNEKRAKEYAARLKATGYLSEATAEKRGGVWHIDARISDEAYEALRKKEVQAFKDTATPKQPTKSSSITKEPPGTDKMLNLPLVNAMGNVNGSVFAPVNLY